MTSFLRTTALFLTSLASSQVFGATIAIGPNVNISQALGNQAESTISVNPLNTMDLFASETFTGIARYSLNGGLSWTNSNLAALPASIGDVQSAFDQFGN